MVILSGFPGSDAGFWYWDGKNIVHVPGGGRFETPQQKRTRKGSRLKSADRTKLIKLLREIDKVFIEAHASSSKEA
jgi:hypothetical protein